jgi:hypothetical protein
MVVGRAIGVLTAFLQVDDRHSSIPDQEEKNTCHSLKGNDTHPPLPNREEKNTHMVGKAMKV